MSDKIERPYGLRGDNRPPVSDENPLAERLGAYLGEKLQALIVRGVEHMGTAIMESLREASSANRSASYNKKESTPSEATKLEYQQLPEPTRPQYQRIPDPTRPQYQRIPDPTRPQYQRIPEPTRPQYQRIPEPTRPQYQWIPDPTKLEYQQIPEVTKRRYQQRPKEQLHALIFYSEQGREDGATEEALLLKTSLTKVTRHVSRYEWSTASELQRHVQISLEDLSSECSLLFISVMSHGTMGALCGTDDVKIPINDLIDQISHVIPANLPLVLLVQACQHANTGLPRGQFDSVPLHRDARLATSDGCMHIDLRRPKTVLLMSTVSGGYALRGAYIKALAAEISRADGKRNIHDMHVLAVNAMRETIGEVLDRNHQVPKYTDTVNNNTPIMPKARN